jgi:hypothetical protein
MDRCAAPRRQGRDLFIVECYEYERALRPFELDDDQAGCDFAARRVM